MPHLHLITSSPHCQICADHTAEAAELLHHYSVGSSSVDEKEYRFNRCVGD